MSSEGGFTPDRAIALILLALTACLVLASCAVPRTNSNAIALFDAHTLTGWTVRGGQADFSVEDGCIIGRTRPGQPNAFLCTDRTFRDFDLQLEFKIDPRLNSGVQIRSESRPDYQNGRVHGYQVEVDPSPRAWTAGLYDEARRGWLRDLKDNPAARAAFKQGEWNHLRIIASGDEFQTFLNHVSTVRLRDAMTPEGFIALQVHGTPKDSPIMEVRWRNIRLVPLAPPPLPLAPPPLPAGEVSRVRE